MDKVPLDDKILLKEIKEVAKCPICLSLLRPPLWYCVNGHCICMACKGSLTTCPTCRGDGLQTGKNIVLEDILNCFPKPCRFDGCDVFEPEPNMKLHESVCPFRKVSCRLDHCSWKDKANSLFDHLIKEHKAFNTFKEESTVLTSDFKADVDTCYISYADTCNCIFWIFSKSDLAKGKFMICFVCVPTESGIVNDFYSTLNFSSTKKADMKIQYPLKVSNEDVDIDSVFSSETCFTIPLSETKHFFNEEGQLWWSYKIFRDS